MLGKKSVNEPEIGDLVTAKLSLVNVYENDNGEGIVQTVPQNASMGTIGSITESNDNGDMMFEVDNGWVYADEVNTAVNPKYNYPGDAPAGAAKTTQSTKTGAGVWTAINTFLSGIFGVINKKKTPATVDGDTEADTGEGDTGKGEGGTTAKTGTPSWVWFTVGGVLLTGIIVALVWPKKKAQPAPQQPIVLK